MSKGVKIIRVEEKDTPCRLDRFLKRLYPNLTQGRLQKALRTKQIRLNGMRTEANTRLCTGDEIRLPPMEETEERKITTSLSEKDVQYIQSLVIYKDEEVIVLNKPEGLAVQGGSGTTRHVDGLLDGLKYGKERPHLVHRLDKETSGVLILGRTPQATAFLTEAFRTKEAYKKYWALVVGKPEKDKGTIEAPLLKKSGKNGSEQVCVDENGKNAVSEYQVLQSEKGISWVEFSPKTGRTHQLRVHSAYLGCPILGDEKYGKETLDILKELDLPRRMYLHAVYLKIPHPKGGFLKIFAPIQNKLKNSFDFFGFRAKT
jgi:23S rRNA pseudouridine955/2504/2580 synthase